MRANSPNASSVYLAIWALIIILIPFYLFGKTPTRAVTVGQLDRLHKQPAKVTGGVPQIADFLTIGLIGFVLCTHGLRLQRKTAPALAVLACFVGYVFLVNLAWTALLPGAGSSLMRNTLYYGYNLLLFVTFLVLFAVCKEKLLTVTAFAVMASVAIQAALTPIAIRSGGFRQQLFFNSPNQLGYFAVLAASLVYLATRHRVIRLPYQVVFYVSAIYLAVLSLSKAALLGLATLLVIAWIRRPALLAMSIAVLAVVFLVVPTGSDLASKLEKRLFTIESDENLAERGYDRIFNHPEYLVFGAGEGKNNRFLSAYPGELHSSFGVLLFNYGVIGAGLFAGFIFVIVRRIEFGDALCLAPPFLYGLGHHGLRTTLFWTLLAFLCCLMKEETAGQKPQEILKAVR